MKLTKSLLAATFAFATIANAQEAPKFSLSGEFRPRTEWRDGFNYKSGIGTVGTNNAGLEGSTGYIRTDVRAALKATYTTDSYTLFTSFQEVFVLGDRTQIDETSNGNFRVQEAWADIKLGKYSSLKIGRQPLSYDDQRILGGLGWAQQARTHDVGVFKYKKEGYSLDLGFGHNSTGTDAFYTSAKLFSYKNIAFARANKTYGNLNISALVLNNTFEVSTDGTDAPNYDLLTAGIHADLKLDALTLSANGYIQDGNRAGGADVKSAFLASILAKYNATEKTTYGLGYEVISGKTSESAAFFPLYGTNHAFNGFMDRFYVGNNANNGGLKDLQASVATKLAGFGLTLTGHYFKEHTEFDGLEDKDLGSELDFTIAKGFKGYKVVAGYSQYFEANKTALNAKDTQNWAWVMLIIAPKFL
ncbi:hypothetical protein [Wenyingzhuangia sp. 2_MG-2023]|uniref:hypothetical protein n=1 Tax=Wenyingzhuangia sp. 2_MG-2023 TaxID=3062639 RepID=UPI0026E3A9F3|nr:hypothetical protein [Wenyingzhuangia sp. 2_MG-2023]MDO6737958.1 hypothetical protein [Wenyingzhuangia sp. 2_MG-2023]MDO6802688.1 hypothetical protein [Wenyingzhuangia sp. 1_MG-2023]